MFPLGHVGIALGVAFALVRILKKSPDPKTFVIIVGVAAVLPDLIDKPIGLLYGFQGGGRLFAHTLLFSVIVMAVSLVAWRWATRRELATSFLPLLFTLAVWIHLLLDLMWEDPEILLWPAYGLGFPTGEFSWGHLTASPYAMAGEVVGAIILVYLALLLFLGRFNVEGPEGGT
ncbi:MAG: metal-dependent hydrolase [Candidatus Thermoplasmatota archaeon]|nr:metal-dependent hydrolase [Candidatus Thermoplasmatota archaeon]